MPWMRDQHPSLPPIDPDAEERRDQRISDWIGWGAMIGAAIAGAIIGGAIAIYFRAFGLSGLILISLLGYAGVLNG